MYPVLCCLTDKVLLATAGRAVSLDWVTSGSYQVVELRELDNKSIVVVLKKRLRFQACSKDGFEVPGRLFLDTISINWANVVTMRANIMLLDDFLKTRIIQLREFCQVMHVRNDIT